jgi:hypothetical protein
MYEGAIDSVKTALRKPLTAALAVASLAASPAVLADAVTDWNAFADTLALGPPPVRARATAIMHVAMHDAVNSVEPRYESYAHVPRARRGASAEAAARQAAASAIKGAAPSVAAVVDAFHGAWLGGCASQQCLDGLAAGEAAANAILLLRNGDGSATPHLPYTLPPALGVYQPTPVTPATPGPELPPVAPQFAGWANVTPFVLKSGSQFRAEPSPLFQLKSWIYTRDYNEVKRVGEVNSEALGLRTVDQSEIARFWPGGGSNINAVARVILQGRSLDLWQHARLFALINMALSDSAIAVFDTKYTYNFWRPVTAIRAGASDGNAFTDGDADWLSYQNTPPYPDYTCGLTTNVGSGLAVLRSYFGSDRIPYTLTIASGLTRSYRSLSQAGFEAVDARVFGGMHFRTGCVRGLMRGGDVGRYVFKNALRPRGKHGYGH